MQTVTSMKDILKALKGLNKLRGWTVTFIEYADGKIASITACGQEESAVCRLRFGDVERCEMRADLLIENIGKVRVRSGKTIAVAFDGVGIEMQAKKLAVDIQKCA